MKEGTKIVRGPISATKLVPVGTTSVAVLFGEPNLGGGEGQFWCAMPNWKVRQVMFYTQLTKANDKTVLQSVVIDLFCCVYAHQDQFTGACLSVHTLRTAHIVSGSIHREVLLCIIVCYYMLS